MKEEKKSFMLYYDQGEQIALLSDEEAGKLIKALFRFASSGEKSDLENGMTRMCYAFITAQIARDTAEYRKKCERLSQNAKNKRSAKAANASNCNQMPTIEDDTDTDTDTVTETDTDTDTVTVTGTGTAHSARGAKEVPSPAPTAAPQAVPQTAPRLAPRLSHEDRQYLIDKGLPSDYVDQNADRAAAYALDHGKDCADVILDWWKTDRARAPWNQSQTRTRPREPITLGNSFDTDEFFQAALARSFRDMEKYSVGDS